MMRRVSVLASCLSCLLLGGVSQKNPPGSAYDQPRGGCSYTMHVGEQLSATPTYNDHRGSGR